MITRNVINFVFRRFSDSLNVELRDGYLGCGVECTAVGGRRRINRTAGSRSL